MDKEECSTRAKRILLAAVTFLFLSGPLSAQANIVYDWTGNCDGIITPVHGGGSNGCSGQATLHVVTTDAYVPGTAQGPVPPGVLLEALYTDANLSFDFAFGGFFDRNGFGFLLPATFPGAGVISEEDNDFRADASGVWRNRGGVRPGCDPGLDPICAYVATGTGGVWTRVPEPSPLVMLFVGLTGLLLIRRSKLSSQAR